MAWRRSLLLAPRQEEDEVELEVEVHGEDDGQEVRWLKATGWLEERWRGEDLGMGWPAGGRPRRLSLDFDLGLLGLDDLPVPFSARRVMPGLHISTLDDGDGDNGDGDEDGLQALLSTLGIHVDVHGMGAATTIESTGWSYRYIPKERLRCQPVPHRWTQHDLDLCQSLVKLTLDPSRASLSLLRRVVNESLAYAASDWPGSELGWFQVERTTGAWTRLSGRHVVLGQGRDKPVVLDFPSYASTAPDALVRHKLLPSGGFHPSLVSSVTLVAGPRQCDLFALYAIPRSLFVDPWQLDETGREDGVRWRVWAETDLERPAAQIPTWGALVLAKVEVDGTEEGRSWTLPLHARYLEPSREEARAMVEVELPRPLTFFACPIDFDPDLQNPWHETPAWLEALAMRNVTLAYLRDPDRQALTLTLPVGDQRALEQVNRVTGLVVACSWLVVVLAVLRVWRGGQKAKERRD